MAFCLLYPRMKKRLKDVLIIQTEEVPRERNLKIHLFPYGPKGQKAGSKRFGINVIISG